MKDFTTLTTKGQITLPIEMRKALNLKSGVKVQVELVNSTIQIQAVPDLVQVRQKNKAYLKSLSSSAKESEEEALKAGSISRNARGTSS